MPGPICTWEGDFDVNDGTSSKLPSNTPGPTSKRSPHLWERGEAVLEAYERARFLAPAAVFRKTGYELGVVLKGLWPGLLQAMKLLSGTTAGGALIGGIVGFGVPGAVVGAEVGLEVGTAVLNWLGLGFLAVAITQGFSELWATLSSGVKRAWVAPESPEKEYPHEIERAANEIADAVGILFLLIFQGIVAWVFARAGVNATKAALAAGRAASTVGSDAAAADAVAALVKQLRASKLGSGFGDWVEQNWSRLKDDPGLRLRLRPPREGPVGDSPSSSGPSPLTSQEVVVDKSYKKNTVTWVQDETGRTTAASATLREAFPDLERGSSEIAAQKRAAKVGSDGDVGGHIIAHRFMGDQGDVNLFPQEKNFNNSAYKTMENEWADWTKNGKQVNVTITLDPAGAPRPDVVTVVYKVIDPATGEVKYSNSQEFVNEANQTFDRVSSSDMKK